MGAVGREERKSVSETHLGRLSERVEGTADCQSRSAATMVEWHESGRHK